MNSDINLFYKFFYEIEKNDNLYLIKVEEYINYKKKFINFLYHIFKFLKKHK